MRNLQRKVEITVNAIAYEICIPLEHQGEFPITNYLDRHNIYCGCSEIDGENAYMQVVIESPKHYEALRLLCKQYKAEITEI